MINEDGHFTTRGSEYSDKMRKGLELVFTEALEEDVDLTDLSYMVNSLSNYLSVSYKLKRKIAKMKDEEGT